MKNKAVKRIRNRGVSETDAEKRLFKTLEEKGMI